MLTCLACFRPSTSKVEQSFALLKERLPDQRLNASPASEQLAISLILADLNDTEVQTLCEAARNLWTTCFPLVSSRTHKRKRADDGIPKLSTSKPLECTMPNAKPNERSFIKRCRENVEASAPDGCRVQLDTYRAACWTAGHQQERVFQEKKRNDRLVAADVGVFKPHCMFRIPPVSNSGRLG